MAAEISFGGLATGLPTEDLVSSLMAVERRPLERLEADKQFESDRLKAYGELNTLLDDLRSAAGALNITSEVRTTSIRLSSEETISASSSGAATGSYDIAVEQLAQLQKTVSQGFDSDTEALLGSGTVTIGDTVITVDGENNSLEGLASAINAASEETGVRASIINNGQESGNYHLVLTGADASTVFTAQSALTGESGAIDLGLNTLRSAQQAIAWVDGIQVVGNSNSLTGVIPGVTLGLNAVSETLGDDSLATTTLNVEADPTALKEKLSVFVSSYNEIMDWISSGYQLEGESQTAADGDGDEADEPTMASYLRGDATINDIKRSLQSVLTEAVGTTGSLQILSEIGIATQQDGSLELTESKLDAALESKFDEVVSLLAGDSQAEGVMKRFNSYLLDLTSPTQGMYAEKRERYEISVRRLDVQILQKESMMEKIETRIRAQFNTMELLVSNLNAQGDYLTQQMDLIANMTTERR
jgi:flagellar hook-associated protein 2